MCAHLMESSAPQMIQKAWKMKRCLLSGFGHSSRGLGVTVEGSRALNDSENSLDLSITSYSFLLQ
jgi:hypothetical protein